jgi:hypothetical protein
MVSPVAPNSSRTSARVSVAHHFQIFADVLLEARPGNGQLVLTDRYRDRIALRIRDRAGY